MQFGKIILGPSSGDDDSYTLNIYFWNADSYTERRSLVNLFNDI